MKTEKINKDRKIFKSLNNIIDKFEEIVEKEENYDAEHEVDVLRMISEAFEDYHDGVVSMCKDVDAYIEDIAAVQNGYPKVVNEDIMNRFNKCVDDSIANWKEMMKLYYKIVINFNKYENHVSNDMLNDLEIRDLDKEEDEE